MRVNGVCMVHCPGGTLILPHYGLQSQKFLTCLFSLDILVRMCASLALKNLTELRTQCRCFCFAFSHKTLPQKIMLPSLKISTKNLSPIIGTKTKKIRSPKIFPPPKKLSKKIIATADQKIPFNIFPNL